MLRIPILTILFAIVWAVSFMNGNPFKSTNLNTFVVDSVDESEAQNFTLNATQKYNKESLMEYRFTYTLGNRRNGKWQFSSSKVNAFSFCEYTGDHLESAQNFSKKWDDPHDINVMMQYPMKGTIGLQISFVEILVEQVMFSANKIGKFYESKSVVDPNFVFLEFGLGYGTSSFRWNRRTTNFG